MKIFKYVILLSAVSLISGCGFETYQSGDLPPKNKLAVIKTGTHTREQVERMLGAPAFEVDNNTIVYARQVKESQAFLEPKETERDVYVFTFNSSGTLTKKTHLTLDDAKNVGYNYHTTPTEKKELSAIKQLVQNFGRYDAGGRDSTERQ